ncbi:serine/threonine-protein kinase [Nocardiopsis dassonvillei]|uniref:serine/threonine-protein kinase n=1 Tax=Nocardiopsis dassonvillei TaxID=2014 RepID=UPI00366FE8C9
MSTHPSAVTLPATATALTSTDPARIGPYRTLGRLGSGGMGVVYAALDRNGALVAVKLIHPEYSADAEFRARFAREVRLLGRVGGACAVPLLAADTEAERPWLATPLVRGMTLSAYTRAHGPLGGWLLIGLAAGVAEALAQIHEIGIAHRDLKPANVILSPEGPRVLDFGVARAIDQTALTRTGSVLGSPGWISPAHYRGEPPSTADDVFAWGALVSYAATGRPPFGTGDPAAVAHRVISGEPDTAGFTGPLADLAARALSKEASERPTALELVGGVIAASDPRRSHTPPDSAAAAGGVMATVVDHQWQGVRTAPEREFPVVPERRGGTGRVLTVVGAALGALVLLAGLGFGGVALAANWDSLPVAAWFGDEPAETAEARQAAGEQQNPERGHQERPDGASSEEPSASPSEEASQSAGDEGDSGGGSTTTTATVGAGVGASGTRPPGEHVVAFQPSGGSGQYAVLDGATVVCAWSFCQSQGGSVGDGSAGSVASSPSALTGYVNQGSRVITAEVTYTTAADGTVTITRLVERHSTSGTGTPPW